MSHLSTECSLMVGSKPRNYDEDTHDGHYSPADTSSYAHCPAIGLCFVVASDQHLIADISDGIQLLVRQKIPYNFLDDSGSNQTNDTGENHVDGSQQDHNQQACGYRG
jgi:hypothetical protein